MKLSDTNRYYLKGTTALHLATVIDGVKEYVCFALNGQIYIEEITGGRGPDFIEDDVLALYLHDFLMVQGVLDSRKPLLPDADWYKRKPDENHS